MARHNNESDGWGGSAMGRTAEAIGSGMACALDNLRTNCQRLEEEAVVCARRMDRTVHEHPYQVLGAVFGLGVMIGLLIPRN